MKYLFCVTSALTIDYGAYSYEDRLHQLIDSIRSIKKYAPGSDIVLLDITHDSIPEPDRNLLSQLCNDMLALSEHPMLKISKQVDEEENKNGNSDPKRMFVKTLGELANMDAIVSYSLASFKKYDRVFKLTGRYRINEDFTKIDYTKLANKMCMLHEVCWDRPIFPMRLWSFDPKMIDQMKNLVIDMIDNNTSLGNGEYNIIEFSFRKCILDNNISFHSVPIIGCEGNMFDGHFVRE